MKNKIVRLEIVDAEPQYGDDAVLGVFYLKNPDEKKLEQLQKLMNASFDCDDENYNEDFETLDGVSQFIFDNFETVEIETTEVEW